MPRMPLATAALLAIALSVAGCGDDQDTPAGQPAAAPDAPAGSAGSGLKVDEAAAKAVVGHYAELAFATYSDALTSAQRLQQAVEAFLAKPSQATQQAAKDAWLAARVPYLQSEVFRFGNPVVDDWEGQVNAWPLDEGLIDYVAQDYPHALGNPAATANIIANRTIQVGEDAVDVTQLDGEVLQSLNELGGSQANVATGYHAIEFLLWGQDLHGSGPGAGERPASDYLQGPGCSGGHCQRRAAYLAAVTEQLVADLEYMVGQWQPGVADNYRASLEAEPAENGLRKMLFGMGSLSLGELAGERLKVPLEANSTEDEQDCFSDNTHNAHFYDAKGIQNVYLGEYRRLDGTILRGASLSALLAKVDPPADAQLQADLDASLARLQALVDAANRGEHFDQLIAAGNTRGNQLVRDAIAALVQQTTSIEQAAARLGISDLNPDTADHRF